MGERVLQAYQHAFDIPYTVCRVCVPYGTVVDAPGSYGTIGAFLKIARKGDPICIFGDGCQRRTVTHMADLVAQVIGLAESEAASNDIFNIGGEPFRLRELAECIARRYGVAVIHRDWPTTDLRLESGSTVFDDTRTRQLLRGLRQKSFVEWVASLQ